MSDEFPPQKNIIEKISARHMQARMVMYSHLIRRALERCMPDEMQRNFFLDNFMPIPSLTFQTVPHLYRPADSETVRISFMEKLVLEATISCKTESLPGGDYKLITTIEHIHETPV